MDEIIVAGKRYISSKRASALSGYAKDYVGQLIRQGKIPGTRVGRAWYADMEAILKHSGRLEQAVEPTREEIDRNFLVSRVPRLTPALIQSQYSLPKTWSTVTYEHDDEKSVEPFPQKSSAPVTTKSHEINMADIKQISATPIINAEQYIHDQKKIINIVRTKEAGASKMHGPNEGRNVKRPGMKRAVVSFALLFVGLFAFSSLSSGLFVSRSIISTDHTQKYAAGVFFGSEYILDTYYELMETVRMSLK